LNVTTYLRRQVVALFAALAAVNFTLAALSSRPDTDIPLCFGFGCALIVIMAAVQLR
jgi:hypothetical protein